MAILNGWLTPATICGQYQAECHPIQHVNFLASVHTRVSGPLKSTRPVRIALALMGVVLRRGWILNIGLELAYRGIWGLRLQFCCCQRFQSLHPGFDSGIAYHCSMVTRSTAGNVEEVT